jgi:protein SCO1/2
MISTALLAMMLAADPAPSRLPVIQTAPEFALTTQDGKSLRSADLKGKVLLVGFIFTTCSGTCPATTHRMAQVQQELTTRGLLKDDRVHFISITLDPARDSQDALQRYMKLYDLSAKHWSFLTGEPKAVEKAYSAWGMWAKPAANGQLDHPSRVFLVDAKGQVREIYNLSFLRAAWVADDIALLLKEARPSRKR